MLSKCIPTDNVNAHELYVAFFGLRFLFYCSWTSTESQYTKGEIPSVRIRELPVS